MKKKTAVPTVKSVIAQFAAYREVATNYIYKLHNPMRQQFFSAKGYEKVDGRLKPSVISVPELLAIVGTANRLGKLVELTTSGVDDGGQINVVLTDRPSTLPEEMSKY